MTPVTVKKLHTLSGHRDAVYTVVQGDRVDSFFSGAGDGMVVRWDMTAPNEGDLIARLPNSIYALSYIRELDVLVAAHNYDGIHVLDWKGKRELSSLKLTDAAIFDLQTVGKQIFIATADGTLTRVDLGTMTVINKTTNSQQSARTIAVHPVNGDIAVGYSDYSIRIFDPESLILKNEWRAHANSVFTLRYTNNGRFLLSGSRDARLKAWDPEADYVQAEEVVAHMYAINSISFSPDSKHFVTCSLDKSIKLWDADQLKLLKVIDKARHAGHGTSVNKLLWTAYDGQVVSASDDRTISIWKFIF